MTYKAIEGFELREVAGDYLLTRRGAAAIDFGAVVVFNDAGVFLWKQLAQPCTEQALAQQLIDAYGITAQQSQADVKAFLRKCLDEGMILAE